MAWVFTDKRVCPSCTSSARVLVIQCRDGFRLSCSACARLSDAYSAIEAFFRVWGAGAHAYPVGTVLELDGVPHWNRGAYVESIPIKVLLSRDTALVMERKAAA